jgi:hypothetical protein
MLHSYKIGRVVFDFFTFVVVIISFFPYVTLYSFGTDLQPWSIFLIMIYSLVILFYRPYIPKELILLIIPFFTALFLLLVSDNFFDSIRSLLGYASVLFIPFAFYDILIRNKNVLFFSLKVSTLIYFSVGLIQFFFDKVFFSFLLNRITTTANRGVTSLTPEPTFYGLVCLFLILIFLNLEIKNKSIYVLILVFQILFLAQSSMVILFLFIFLSYYFLSRIKVKNFLFLLFFSFVLFLSLFYLKEFSSGSGGIRVLEILSMVLESPMDILMLDASINDRASAIYFSLKGFFDNYFLPHGFGIYSSYVDWELTRQEVFSSDSTRMRIMSYYGGAFFELGFYGFFIPVSYMLCIISAYKYSWRGVFLYFGFINTILFSAIPLTFTFLGIFVACLLYKGKKSF